MKPEDFMWVLAALKEDDTIEVLVHWHYIPPVKEVNAMWETRGDHLKDAKMLSFIGGVVPVKEDKMEEIVWS